MISKKLLDRIRKIPGGWILDSGLIRHSYIKDDDGYEACPLVALLWHEEEREFDNYQADDIDFEDDIGEAHEYVQRTTMVALGMTIGSSSWMRAG